ncbi:nitrogenase cofactor biosynthesis protein NifB [Dehalobacter sp. DCM]|uniref:nitrogenase cofactor biosynthesis protein NifB n=1 Tax=Dehalobacter sp. DCM TaxID=2907827 RepID=UPI003081ABA2|nr:nitrogenase cofactor biosynthesis protein NifB [Dehalobacter sp. DCM]
MLNLHNTDQIKSKLNTTTHPCYSSKAQHKYARIHLPVAPACNISCNYCRRDYDCVNESRPGVTSKVLDPEAALERFQIVRKKLNNLSVVGIAGPGDALANWEKTKRTLELILQDEHENNDDCHSEINFCLSTNGLLLPELAEQIVALNVRHVTVTVNSIDPKIGAQIYNSVNYHGITYTGTEGAELLIRNQLEGIKKLVDLKVLVKVNIVMIDGTNDSHIPEIVKKLKELGVFTTNIMGFIPVKGSVFENRKPTDPKNIMKMRLICGKHLQQMSHCKHCRADAVGMLGKDCSGEIFEIRKKCKNHVEAG